MLCLRFGGKYIHPDYLMADLTAGQFEDWLRVHRQLNVGIDRDDLLWGFARAEFINANLLGETDVPISDPREVMPYCDPEEMFEDDITVEKILGIVRDAKAMANAANQSR